MPDAFCQGSFRGVLPRLLCSPPAHLPAHPTPALVAHAQGGLTLGPERGELAADFWDLGINQLLQQIPLYLMQWFCINQVRHQTLDREVAE